MPGVCRLNDISTGHGGWPPRRNDQASTSSYVDGRGVHRVTDHWPTHCDPEPQCHDGNLADGSHYHTTDGKRTGRIGDPVNCGDHVAEGSSYKFIG